MDMIGKVRRMKVSDQLPSARLRDALAGLAVPSRNGSSTEARQVLCSKHGPGSLAPMEITVAAARNHGVPGW